MESSKPIIKIGKRAAFVIRFHPRSDFERSGVDYLFLSEMYSSPRKELILNCIHEGALDFFEHDDSEEKERGGDCGGDSEALPWDCAAQEDGAETLNDGSHGVEIHEESVFFRNHACRVDDGGGIHGELDAETDEKGEIAVFCGERGDDDTGPKP